MKTNYLPYKIISRALAGGVVFFASSVHAQTAPSETLPSITVTASPLDLSLFDYEKPISVLTEEQLQDRNQSTLGETIAEEPGVRSSFFGPGASRPIIRGFGGDRVRVLRNGVTTGDVSDISDDHVVVADPMQAKQIEILRGPETLLYGSSAIGGAVNVTDESIPEKALGKPVEGQMLGQLGDSADEEQTLGAKLRGEAGAFNWYLSGFSRSTDDYKIPGFAESSRRREQEAEEAEHEHDHEMQLVEGEEHEEHHEHDEEDEVRGKVPNTDTDTWGATAGGSYVWDKGFVGLAVSGFGSEYGIPGHSHPEGHEHEAEEADHDAHAHEDGAEEEGVRIDAEQLRVDLRGRVNDVSDALESVKFRMGYTDYTHDEIEGGQVDTTFDRNTVEGRLEFVHRPIDALRGVAGVQLLFDDFSATGEEAFLPDVTTSAPAVFLFEKLALSERTDLQFGGRLEVVAHDPDGLNSETFVPFSLSAGPVVSLTGNDDYSLGLTFSYNQRAPNPVELYANGPHVARQIFEIGNSDLGKEASWGTDLVFRKNRGVITGSITPFYQDFSNYLNLAGTGGEEDGFPVFAYEEVDASFWGFEFESAFHLDQVLDLGPHAISLEYQFDMVRARNETQREDLPRIPPLRNIVRARYDFAKELQASVEGVFVSSQNDVAEHELPTDSYALLNADISMKVPYQENRDMKFFVRGTNLTDEEARVHSSFLKDLAPLRGRAFLFGIRGTY